MYRLILVGATKRILSRRRAVARAVARASLLAAVGVSTTVCWRAESPARRIVGSGCFRVAPSGPMSTRDSTKIATLFQLVRMDSTHMRWNSEVDSATRQLRYLYLSPVVENRGWSFNAWSKDAMSGSLRWWGGNGFSAVELVLTPVGRSLAGYATVGGDAPGGHPRYLGPVRADPAACGPLLHRRPSNPDSGWSTDGDTTPGNASSAR